MQKHDLFQQSDYKKFILNRIQTWPGGGRGVRKQLASAIGCQVGFITHVLGGDYHLSQEQAERVCRFLGLSREETEFFLLLVQHNRAGTRELRSFLEQLMTERREKQLLLKERLKIRETLNTEDQATYYQHWYFAAIHMLLTIPEFQNPVAIQKKLDLAPRTVNRVLDFLLTRGLIRQSEKRLIPTGKYLHLEKESPLLDQHLRNLHLFAIQKSPEADERSVRYAAFMSCSRKDVEKVREKLVKTIEECAELVKPSPEEELVSFCVDWQPV